MQSVYKKYKLLRVALHIFVWATYFFVFLWSSIVRAPLSGQIYFVLHILILMVAIYTNMYVLVKKYFEPDRYTQYIYGVLSLWLLGLLLIYLSGVILNYPPVEEYFFKKTIAAMVGFSMEFFLATLYKVAKVWYLKAQKAKEHQLGKIQAELGLLRSQLDAHFLFNTLNNIYLLVLNKSEKAPDAVLRLSELLSYNIYDGYQDKVKLSKELDFIENYISLQKLRLDETQQVFYEVKGSVEGEIEPLILFNFIENAFKHAYETVVVDKEHYYVYISIFLAKGSLRMNVKNRYNDGKQLHGDNSGVGHDNTIKRLDLTYENSYDLEIDKTSEQIYNVTLTIKGLL